MSEHIPGARRSPPLVEQFGRHQPGQPVLYCGLVLRRDGPEHVVGELPAEHRAKLRHLFGRGEAIQAGHQGILQGLGNRHGGQRAGQHIVLAVGT
jgi:hypothetical protein